MALEDNTNLIRQILQRQDEQFRELQSLRQRDARNTAEVNEGRAQFLNVFQDMFLLELTSKVSDICTEIIESMSNGS